ncbi:MAG: hypothetical protein GYB67_08105 [Chloroflexi bacterium]|nr:hypothetical protein [Chloroflexota bacterium]
MITPDDLARRSRPARWALVIIFTLAALAAVAVGRPFRYADAESGRYLVPVLAAADAELFPDDPYVASIGRFASVFYDALAAVYQLTDLPTDSLPHVMLVLYMVWGALLMMALAALGVTMRPGADGWLVIALLMTAAVLMAFNNQVGGGPFIERQIIHRSVAGLLCVVSLTLLLRRAYLPAWIIAAAAIFVHALITIHFALVAGIVVFGLRRDFTRNNVIGAGLLALSAGVYTVLFGPPNFTEAEAALFIAGRGDSFHISPLSQPVINWLTTLALLAVTLAAYWRFARQIAAARFLAGMVVVGVVAGLGLSSAAVITQNLTLMQFQPMRIFVWVAFAALTLLILTTVAALPERRPLSALLMAAVFFALSGSLYFIPVAALIVGLIILDGLLPARRRLLDRLGLATMLLLAAAVIVLFRAPDLLPGALEFHRGTFPTALMVILIAVMIVPSPRGEPVRTGLSVLIGFVLLLTSVQTRDSAERARHADNTVAAAWITELTPPGARVLTAYTVASDVENWRAHSLRTSVGEPANALLWVEPLLADALFTRTLTVWQGWDGRTWDLAHLRGLAAEWDAAYIVIVGAARQPGPAPAFRSGQYAIYPAAIAAP